MYPELGGVGLVDSHASLGRVEPLVLCPYRSGTSRKILGGNVLDLFRKELGRPA
jgi:hypothetical protein